MLHVQVSAAAVVVDSGKAFEKLDKALGGAGESRKGRGENEPAPGRRDLTASEVTEIARGLQQMRKVKG